MQVASNHQKLKIMQAPEIGKSTTIPFNTKNGNNQHI